MKNIAIVTPNTDTFTNPTLTALFQLLKEKGVEVYLFGPRQQPGCPAGLTHVTVIPSGFRLHLFRNPKKYISHFASYGRVLSIIRKKKISTLLAVDPLGVIIGGRIKKLFCRKLHLSYISFEIFFKEELTGHYLALKEKEIFYAAFVDSLLIQDEKRKNLLLQENRMTLSDENIALVPVSPMKIEVKNAIDIHRQLNIPPEKKLAVYSGSVGEWCGTQAIIEAFDKGYWNNDYWLVFHTRKSILSDDSFYADLKSLDADVNIPFSLHPHPFDSFEGLSGFLSGFDLALALYYPNNQNPYYGMNMKEIGLSSGKFSTYMMLGLPTIVTSCSIYEELLLKYRFGAILDDIKNFKIAIQQVEQSKNETHKLYNEILDPEVRLMKYVDFLK